MEYNVGDIIELVRPNLHNYRHKGALGKILDIRSYCCKGAMPTHYVVKFTCYTIPHVYTISEIEQSCQLYKVRRR